MLNRQQFLKHCFKSLRAFQGKLPEKHQHHPHHPQIIWRNKINRLQFFLLPSSHFSTTSKTTTEAASAAIAIENSGNNGELELESLYSARTAHNSRSRTGSGAKKESIDSLGTWDTTTDLPLAVKQSIASGKPIPSISPTSIGVSTSKGRRQYNEDQYDFQRLDESFLYFAVFDGHGGAECAKFCASMIPKTLCYWFKQDTETSTAIHNTFLQVNNTFARWFKARQKEEGDVTSPSSGSTATVCLLHNSVNLYVGHVGDSRAIICRSGEPQKLTQDHVPSLITEKERIEKSGGRCSQTRVNERLAMSRSIGDLDLKRYGVIAEPEVRMLKIDHSRDAFLVLTTDGINHVMTDKEIVETVKQTEEPQYAATLLTETAFQYNSEDNITAMVIPLGSWGKYSAAATIFHSFGKSMNSSTRFG